ncbi:MAG: glycosyltransferase involved in cell wall biosynthesis [Halieaceae bacterium]|jgi:glycosyltransferase involved in cell wall biosynthesis
MYRKRLLFVTPQLPQAIQDSLNNGSWQVLSLLANEYDVALACPLASDEEESAHQLCERLGISNCFHGAVDLKPSRPEDLQATTTVKWGQAFSSDLRSRIEQVSGDYDILVIDHFVSFFYLPTNFQGLKAYNAHAAHFDRNDKGPDSSGFSMTRFFGNVEPQHLRKKEVQACGQVDLVFAQPEDAAALSDAGVPFGKLQFSLTGQRSYPPGKSQTFNTTNKQLGYVGYLGDKRNVSSLLWFIRNVWPIALQQHPELELHLQGKDPDLRLLTAAMDFPNIIFHTTRVSSDLRPLDCRIAIDPLLYEDHAEAKLVNALIRGIPTLTTSMGASKSTLRDGDGVLAAEGAHEMASQIHQLLTNKPLWNTLHRKAQSVLSQRLPYHHTFYSMRKAMAGYPALSPA